MLRQPAWRKPPRWWAPWRLRALRREWERQARCLEGITPMPMPDPEARYRDPEITWHNEAAALAVPQSGPPCLGPFTITRSEIVVRAASQTAVVHLWYAYEPAVSRSRPDPGPRSYRKTDPDG